MIKINGTVITSDVLFRKFFDLDVVLGLVRRVAIDDTLFTEGKDLIIQQILRGILADGMASISLTFSDGAVIMECDDNVSIPLTYLTVDGANEIKEIDAGKLKIVLLHELAHKSISVKELMGIPAEASDGVEYIPNTLVLHSDQRMEFTLFVATEVIKNELRTVKIINASKLDGFATLIVKNQDGMILDMIRLKNGETLFANFVGNYFVEFILRFAVSTDHCNYLVYNGGGKATIGRYIFATEQTFTYSVDDEITQFCPDDEGGFIGIANGCLLPYTSLLNPMDDFDFPVEEDEKFVKVVICGKMLLALTNKGRTFSNYRNNILSNLSNIVSIGVGPNYTMYVLTSEAKLFFNVEGWKGPVDNIYSVCSLNPKTPTVKTRDGITHFYSGKTSTGIGKQMKSESGLELKIEPVTGELIVKGTDLVLDHYVDDFTICENIPCCVQKPILIYYDSHVEQLKR